MIDLADAFEDLWPKVPDIDDEVLFLALTPDNLPIPPELLVTDSICISPHLHSYCSPVDAVSIEADKAILGKLGLLLFSTVLYFRQSRVTLNLTHPRSTIRRLVIDPVWGRTERMPGLHLKATQFNYWPSVAAKHPWYPHNGNPWELPILYLTNERDLFQTHKDLDDRDIAVGFGNVHGTCSFAELLLNASRPSSKQLEFALECEIGFRGVGPGSAEITIHLPGSIGNLDHEPVMDD
jgi:hypothetical protein